MELLRRDLACLCKFEHQCSAYRLTFFTFRSLLVVMMQLIPLADLLNNIDILYTLRLTSYALHLTPYTLHRTPTPQYFIILKQVFITFMLFSCPACTDLVLGLQL